MGLGNDIHRLEVPQHAVKRGLVGRRSLRELVRAGLSLGDVIREVKGRRRVKRPGHEEPVASLDERCGDDVVRGPAVVSGSHGGDDDSAARRRR
ncbi:MAG: hypothetical protein ABI783_00370 [Actinomycetota bacterium]